MKKLPEMLFSSKERFGFRLLVLSLAIALSGGWSSAAADMYKWTDNEGRVHYSDRLPAQEAKDISLQSIRNSAKQTVRPRSSEHKPTVVKRWEEAWKKRQQVLEEKRRPIREKQVAAKEQRRSEACDKASAVSQLLADSINKKLYRRDKYRPEVISASALTRSEIESELRKWQKKAERNCPKGGPDYTRAYSHRELPFAIGYK